MGWGYLDGKTWAEVTRDERYFCQQLFAVVQRRGVREFVELLSQITRLPLASDVEWEIGYEVCFYRDLWQLRGGKGQLHSPKRTFDLCLFSQRQLIIIEAKAQQGFDKDKAQLHAFAEDKRHVSKLTGLESVLLVGLASSQHIEGGSMRNVEAHFNGRLMSWKELADHYSDEPETASFLRADAIYTNDAGGKHNERKLSGEALAALHAAGERFQVGRSGGVNGRMFASDVATGAWRKQLYETTGKSLEDLNGNWFSLDAFQSAVTQGRESESVPCTAPNGTTKLTVKSE